MRKRDIDERSPSHRLGSVRRFTLIGQSPDHEDAGDPETLHQNHRPRRRVYGRMLTSPPRLA
jgi:hypothetical protein